MVRDFLGLLQRGSFRDGEQIIAVGGSRDANEVGLPVNDLAICLRDKYFCPAVRSSVLIAFVLSAEA